MKKIAFVSIIAASALVFSCKKDKDKKSTQELIQGKWNVLGWTENDHENGQDQRDTTVFPVGYKTREFLNNGKVVDKWFTGDPDTMTYKFEGSKLLISEDAAGTRFDTLTIKTLTETELQLHYKSTVASNGDYYEYTDNFKK